MARFSVTTGAAQAAQPEDTVQVTMTLQEARQMVHSWVGLGALFPCLEEIVRGLYTHFLAQGMEPEDTWPDRA